MLLVRPTSDQLRTMANALFHGGFIAIVGYIVSAIGVWILTMVVYLRWFHPLAKIPGPFWASITHFYIVKYNLFSERSQFYLQIEKLHHIYGMRNFLGELGLGDSCVDRPCYPYLPK
jgi:hypothetical protein